MFRLRPLTTFLTLLVISEALQNVSAHGGDLFIEELNSKSPGLIVAIILFAIVVVTLLIIFILVRRRTICSHVDHSLVWKAKMGTLSMRFGYKQLSEATNGFDEKLKLGEGGFGPVYRGFLPGDGPMVAIKKLDNGSAQGVQEFMAEVKTITQIRHRNIVQLLGWCKHENKFLLVYEYMPNGSLDRSLFHASSSTNLKVLTWSQRFKIIFGIAAALDYLHEGWIQKVIHRDIKSSNIMLDSQFCAKLGDFGLARMNAHQNSLATTNAAGTYGYLAPEAAFFGKYTVKSDVFAFGAVVLEIACGRRALDTRLPSEESVLKDWVEGCLQERRLMLAADQQLKGEYNESEMHAVLLLGLVCSDSNPSFRPSMRQVLQVLSKETPMLPCANQPPRNPLICPQLTSRTVGGSLATDKEVYH